MAIKILFQHIYMLSLEPGVCSACCTVAICNNYLRSEVIYDCEPHKGSATSIATECIQISTNESIYRFVFCRQLAKLHPRTPTILQINDGNEMFSWKLLSLFNRMYTLPGIIIYIIDCISIDWNGKKLLVSF